MSNVHKYPTISFRVSDYERREIEAKIKASGMRKKDYFARSCIYNRVCVVGKKETIYPLVEQVRQMQESMERLGEQFGLDGTVPFDEEEMGEMQTDYLNLLKAVLWLLEGAKYLWETDKKSDADVTKEGDNRTTQLIAETMNGLQQKKGESQ
jgi:hypothetical protein